MTHTDSDGLALVFTDEEQQLLTEHRIAVHRGKIILNAQPPITDAQVAEIAKFFGEPVPETLIELWNVAYGGELDYDLNVPLGEHAFSASFRELFYPGSNGYRGLVGWIEAEQEMAYEASLEDGSAPKDLRYFPFGGFEYLERFYVDTAADSIGTVMFWARGLPPAWKGRLTEDTHATVCKDIPSLFDMMKLDVDPRTAEPKSYPSGLDTLEAIDRLRADSADLAARLEKLLFESIFDARGLVTENNFDDSPQLVEAGRLGWITAAQENDEGLADALLAHNYPTDRVIRKRATPLTYAIASGATAVANRLLDSGRPLGTGVVIFVKGADVELIDRLVSADVAFDDGSVVSAAKAGDVDVAVAIANNARRSGEWKDIKTLLLERATRERDTANKLEAKEMGSYATADEHRAMAEGLETVAGLL